MKEQQKLKYQLNYCILELEQLLDKGSSKEWNTRDYKELAQFINDKSGFNISVSTLKRIWGRVNYQFVPNEFTLDVLTATLGYSSWKDYISTNDQNINKYIRNTKEKDLLTSRNFYKRTNRDNIPTRKFMIGGIFLFFSIIIIFFSLTLLKNSKSPPPPEIIKSISDSIDTIPYNTKIYFDVSEFENQNVYLKLGTNKYLIRKQTNFHNTRVVEPGFQTYSLYLDDQKIKQFNLYGLTDGWSSLLINQKKEIKTIAKTPQLNGNLFLSDSIIDDLVGFENLSSLKYIKVQKFNVRGDSLYFETRFKYKDLLRFDNQCQNIVITLMDKKQDFISLNFASDPCLSNTSIHFDKKTYNGKSSDIPFMNINTSEWNTTRIVSQNNQFNLFINDSLCLKEPYLNKIGDVMVIKIIFFGSGMLDYVKLGNSDSNWELNDHFQ